jgi:hypothetical protein
MPLSHFHPITMADLRSELGSKIRLFSDDMTLPSPAKKRFIKAVTIDTLGNSKLLSPVSQLFQKQVKAIDGINQYDSPTKNTMVTQLATNFAFPETVSKVLASSQKMEQAGVAKVLVFSPPPVSKQVTYFSSSSINKKNLWQSIPLIKHPSQHHAIQSLGPTARVVKTPSANSFDASCEYACNVPSCGVKMRLSIFQHGTAAIQVLGSHTHPEYTWEEALSLSSTPNTTPLPPIVKAHAASILDNSPNIDPKDLIRQTIKHFHTSPLFATQRLREIIGNKIYNYQRNKVAPDAITGCHTKPKPITFTADLVKFKEEFTLQFPEINFTPIPVNSEEHIVELAHHLESRGYLKGKKHVQNMPHRDLIVLPMPDDNEPGMDRFTQLSKTRTQPAAENTTVFSSLALLQNACYCERLEWRVGVCGDFAHGMVCNDYMLMMFGVIDINHRKARGRNVFTKSFRPLGYAFGQGEREEVALLAELSVKAVVRRLFGIEIRVFGGGMVSDHTNVFTNSFTRAFPGNQLLQCYPHILRKFRIDEKRTQNGGYRKFVNNHAFLKNIAIQDVRFLHRCRTKAMFLTLASFVVEAWRAADEQRLADVFEKSYVSNNEFNNWFYSCSGIHGCLPQNNTLERTNLEVKGSSIITGLLKVGRNMTNAFHVEFPKMVYNHSTERIGVTRNYLILDVDKAINTAAMEYYNHFKVSVDAVKSKEGWLVNSLNALGKELTTERIDQYDQTLEGTATGITHETRWTYFYHVESICYVCEEAVDAEFAKKMCYVCTCETFWKELSCPHAVLFQHRQALDVSAYKLPTKRRARLSKELKAALSLSTDKSSSAAIVTHASSNVISQLTQPSQVNEKS